MKGKVTNLLRPLIRTAVNGAEGLPAADRADVFEGIAHITRKADPTTSREAAQLAHALREAEGLQLHFRNLFADHS